MQTPESLTPALISRLIGKPVTSLALSAIDEQRGYMASVYRAKLTGNNVPASVIIKFASESAAQRSLADRFNSYKKETRFYADLAEDLPVATPTCLYNAADSFLLILEDLGPGAITDTVSLTDAALAMQTMATIHGHFRQRPPDGFPDISEGLEAAVPDMRGFVTDRLGELPTRPGLALMARYAANSDKTIDRFKHWPKVFCHLDFRLDNLRFLANELVVFDWGEATMAPPGFDLATFMVTSMDVDLRRASELSLLKRYHQHLETYQTGISFDTVYESYQLALLPAFYLAALVMTDGELAEGMRLADRCLSAIEDHQHALGNLLA